MRGRRWALSPLVLALVACEPEPPANPDNPFELVRVDAAGQQLSASTAAQQAWSCALDRRTGLMWEVKSPEPGLRFAGNTYSWYAPNAKHQELDYRGLADGGECSGSACDTAAYVTAVNAVGLCGHRDWRMPHIHELGSISDPRRPLQVPTTDMRFFPNTRPGEYWSANDYSLKYDAAWVWGFDFAQDRVDWKTGAKHVRLVRGQVKGVKKID